ncbi:hypothetical protein OPT61_g4191 [Boeremia exigua]|uniref:Uncharacterized protein n=1 Tax=Boeremia exigua TaxID=749465 RepID=A0ACC2IF47_9PLEO|nr:hypothetical protein OPT61_g4191 [Boeremia exigua]
MSSECAVAGWAWIADGPLCRVELIENSRWSKLGTGTNGEIRLQALCDGGASVKVAARQSSWCLAAGAAIGWVAQQRHIVSCCVPWAPCLSRLQTQFGPRNDNAKGSRALCGDPRPTAISDRYTHRSILSAQPKAAYPSPIGAATIPLAVSRQQHDCASYCRLDATASAPCWRLEASAALGRYSLQASAGAVRCLTHLQVPLGKRGQVFRVRGFVPEHVTSDTSAAMIILSDVRGRVQASKGSD